MRFAPAEPLSILTEHSLSQLYTLAGQIQQDTVMKHTIATNPHVATRIGRPYTASIRGDATRARSILFKVVGPSMYCPTSSRCMIRVRGGRLCGAPAMANGRCRQHGGKMTPDQHSKRPRIEHIIRAGLFGTNGCALNDAVVAYRTQKRLERLVDIASRRSALDPDHGALGSAEPARRSCVLPN